MILYLVRRYLFLATIIIGAVPGISRILGVDHAFFSAPSVVFWGSGLALVLLYRRFEQRNLWVLYDNLRWPPFVLLGGLFVGTQVVSLTLFLRS